jgi:hypothetical protein
MCICHGLCYAQCTLLPFSVKKPGSILLAEKICKIFNTNILPFLIKKKANIKSELIIKYDMMK